MVDATDLLRDGWHAVRGPLAIVGLTLLVVLVARWRARSQRNYVRLRLIPYRADEADPAQVRRLLEAWHQQLLERWWRRIPRGQRGMALELAMGPDAEGDRSGVLSVVCPEELAGGVEGTLLACYPDSRLVRGSQALPRIRRVVRLKKRFHFVRALAAPEDEGNPVDAFLNGMAGIAGGVVLQYTLVPTPALFDRYSRWRFASRERASERARANDPGNPGLRSEVLGRELRGGLEVQHHPLFFAEVRVGASSYRAATTLAGNVRGRTGAQNRLVERYMRPWARGPLYRRRLLGGVGNPLPSWRRGVFSSAELTALWRLPSPGLKNVRVARSPLPRVPAPPEVSRDPAHVLARDERGDVGIRPEDKTDGLGLIGGQKTGKTSLLCRTVRADAVDGDCAVIVLMPKPGDALQALSMVPPERTAHYLDLERPEFGINPLLADGDAAMIADKVVQAFRDVNMEGDIRGSSDRYLRQAAQAAIGASRAGAVEGPPTLWHMYRMLLPVEAAFRRRVVEALLADPAYTDTAVFFGRELPHDLRDAPFQTVAKLDAPRNKLLRLMVESLDKVLRHPLQLDLDRIIRRREVLIVDGKMGTFGADNCRVMMQFILNSLYGALQRQQQLPEAERVRVALKVDEAHLILNESFADALATLRSAGLEVVAAWQYSDQIQDPKIRSGMLSLLRQRCMFSMGEESDARALSTLAMTTYADVIRTDDESRERARITPDVIFNLPNHHAVCSWISRGARAPAFVARTIPLQIDEAVVAHHLDHQRERGGYLPERLPDPLPDLDWKGLAEIPVAPSGNGQAAELVLGPSSVDRPTERPGAGRGGPPAESFTELDLDGVRGIIWDEVAVLPTDRRHEPTARELEILAALWSYRFLFATQIHRRWWRGGSLRTAQEVLTRMTRAGWVRRFKFQLAERGAQQRVYCLTRAGFELAQGSSIGSSAKWREPQIGDARRALRDLRANGWVLSLERLAPKAVVGWRGPRENRLDPPRGVSPADVIAGTSRHLHDYEPERFEGVSPDAIVELRVAVGERPLRFDLLVELDMAGSSAALERRLRRYDGLVSGWAGLLDRYRALGTPPVIVFVSSDEPARDSLVRRADRVVTARLAKAGTEEAGWPHPGRRAMFFAVERDMHEGSLEALQLPPEPPDVRARLGGPKQRECRPSRVRIVEPRLLTLT